MNEIAYTKFTTDEIVFPNIRKTKTTIYDLPADDEINSTISKAKEEAIDGAKTLGMLSCKNIDEFNIRSRISFDDRDDDLEEFHDSCYDESGFREIDVQNTDNVLLHIQQFQNPNKCKTISRQNVNTNKVS